MWRTVFHLLRFITAAGFWMWFVQAAEVNLVQFGSTVTLDCNISYLYDTTWFKHSADLIPTVVLCASFREGQPVQGFQLSPRFSVGLMNRSLVLRITDVEDGDLGLYYCIANVKGRLTVGSGTMLQVSSLGSSQLQFHHWYCLVVGSGQLIMVLAVCITHWKTKSHTRTTNKNSTANNGKKTEPPLQQHQQLM